MKFRPLTTDGTPPDLAFIIAPSSPSLLQRKLELKNICFIQSHKVITPPITNKGVDINTAEKDLKVITPPITNKGVDINTAEKDLIVNAFKGTKIKKITIERLMQLRSNKHYKDLDELAADLKLTQNVKQKLQKKVDEGEINFLIKAPST